MTRKYSKNIFETALFRDNLLNATIINSLPGIFYLFQPIDDEHWLGSFALQVVSVNLVSLFSESILKSLSILGPIMYLILKKRRTVCLVPYTKERTVFALFFSDTIYDGKY